MAFILWLTCRTEIKSHLSGNKSLLFSENNPSVNFLYVFIAFVCMAVLRDNWEIIVVCLGRKFSLGISQKLPFDFEKQLILKNINMWIILGLNVIVTFRFFSIKKRLNVWQFGRK